MKTFSFKLAFLVAFLIIGTISVQLNLPISAKVLNRVNMSLKRLQKSLQNFGTPYQNNYQLYKRSELTKGYLQQLTAELQRYNNVILGSGNSVGGDKNIIIGDRNNIYGHGNWVFTSQYKPSGPMDGSLVIGRWRI
jgi:hypothetical protein